MDIELLKTFLEVSRTRHFTRAADNLYVTSAAVSARIKLLESHLGVTLFLRQRGNIQLTNEGERLLPLADTIVTTWDRTLHEVSLQPQIDARIHIGATPGLWMLGLQQQLPAIHAALPDIAVHAYGHATEDLTRLLLERSLDLVLLYDPPQSNEFRAEHIGQLELVLASNGPATLETALTDRYIFVDWGTRFANFHARKFGDSAAAWLHVNLGSIAESLLRQAPGAAFLPLSTVNLAPHLHTVEGSPTFSRPIYACYTNTNPQLETMTAVVQKLHGLSI